jgi:hypothetical protein
MTTINSYYDPSALSRRAIDFMCALQIVLRSLLLGSHWDRIGAFIAKFYKHVHSLRRQQSCEERRLTRGVAKRVVC